MIISPRVMAGVTQSLPTQRKTNAKLDAALSQVPDLDLTIRMINDLVEGAKTIQPRSPRDLTNEVHNSLAVGTGIPANLLDGYIEAVISEQTYARARDELHALCDALVSQRDQLVQGGLSIMISWLHEDLQRIYLQLRELRDAPETAEDAIAQGKVAIFKKASGLRSEYFQIREAHRLIFTYGLGATDDSFAYLTKGWPIVAHASGLAGIWTDLPEWDRYGLKLGKLGSKIKLTPPWPDPNSALFLDWLLEHPEAGPWVPTFDQMLELLNDIKTRAQTLYETHRSPDQKQLDREHEHRRQTWLAPVPHLVEKAG